MAKGNALVRVLPEQHQASLRAADKAKGNPNARPLLHSCPQVPHETVNADAMSVYPTYVIFRCNRWGTYERWSVRTITNDPRPAKVTSWWGPIVLDGNVEQIGIDSVRDICPVNAEEALETRLCVQALTKPLRDAMLQEHVLRGTQLEKARALQIDRSTFWRRCERAYVELLDLFNGIGIDSRNV